MLLRHYSYVYIVSAFVWIDTNYSEPTFSCSFFQACLRTTTLRHNEEGQACLINLLLRNYLHYNLYDQVSLSKMIFISSILYYWKCVYSLISL